uniref:glycosyltransferase n=1 Tax=Ferrovibrio terrae TaxID=2594003 RepID=UPI003137E536
AHHPDGAGSRISVVSIGLPYPATGASRVVFNSYMKALCAAGLRVSHVILADPGKISAAEQAAYFSDIGAPVNSDIAIIDAVPVMTATRWTLKRHSNLQQATEALRSQSPDAVICFDIDAAMVAAPLSRPRKLVWIGDLHYQTIWYHFLYSVRENLRNLVSSLWILRRIRLWQQIYRETLHGFDDIIVCAYRSVADFRKIGLQARFAPYPWPASAVAPVVDRSVIQKPSFIFFGRLGGLGSRSSFHFLLEQLYPQLLANWGSQGFVLDICGLDQLPNWVEALLADKLEIRFLGFVPDLEAQMRAYHAMVVPIDAPVGNRTRILTAMANGLPVVAHTHVALGNPSLVDGVTCRLATEAKGFAAALRWCYEQSAEAAALARRARQSWQDEYSPDVAAGLFATAVDTALNQTQEHRP